MGKIRAVMNMTLDGVVQGPARKDEDPREGFDLGGWAVPYGDEVMAAKVGPSANGGDDGGLLFGRRTYERFFTVWPRQTDGNRYTKRLNEATKYVASTTLAEPLPWEHSVLLGGNVPEEVAALKAQLTGDLVVLGSGVLLRSLLRHGLVDEITLSLYPVALGKGHRLFPEEGPTVPFHLVEVTPTTTGVLIARYELNRAS